MSRGASRDELVAWLDTYLEVGEWTDKSLNGLQVEGRDTIETVATAVDGVEATFELAAEAEAGFLLVHHGIFWGRVEPVVGPMKRRLRTLLNAGVSLYAAHLPLDAHPDVGNNAVLTRLLDLEERTPFGDWEGRTIGYRGRLHTPLSREEFAGRLEALLGERPVILPFGDETIASVAVVSGAASDLIDEAAAEGLDAFVTGESSHVAWHAARERSLNVFFAGHYATETLGVRALGECLANRFGVDTVFLDVPTGL